MNISRKTLSDDICMCFFYFRLTFFTSYVVSLSYASVWPMAPMELVFPLLPNEMECPNPDEIVPEIYYSSDQVRQNNY